VIKEPKIGFPFSAKVEKYTKRFYESLNEKDRRHYVALEAAKLCYGGMTYLSDLLGCSRSTIQEGFEELEKK